ITVNRAKKLYSNIKDIIEDFNKRKIKLQKISNLLFIPKRLRISWNLTQQFMNIEEELWKRCKYEDEKATNFYQIKQHVKKVFLTAILVIILTCSKKKTIIIENNIDKLANITTIIMEQNAYDTTILNE
ncbi:17097_t:CDS:2, partial [Gigaspora rosea]